jgi:hypothetical protein
MSKFASFGFLLLLFLLLSVIVLFGFFIFTPKIKEYRVLDLELQRSTATLTKLEDAFDKDYTRLKTLQEREHNIDAALHKYFNQKRFEEYLRLFFPIVAIEHIKQDKDDGHNIETLDIRAVIKSPSEYYRFIDALHNFEWVVEVNGVLQFKGREDGIATHFTVKVYTTETP